MSPAETERLRALVARLEASASMQGAATEHLFNVLDAEIERVKGRDATVERLTAELASAQQENREWREQAARTHNEVAEILPDDPAVWGTGDVAHALVQTRDALTAAREDVALLRTRSREAAATIDRLRALVEQHEERARVHAEERHGMHQQVAASRTALDHVMDAVREYAAALAAQKVALADHSDLTWIHAFGQRMGPINARVDAARAALVALAEVPK